MPSSATSIARTVRASAATSERAIPRPPAPSRRWFDRISRKEEARMWPPLRSWRAHREPPRGWSALGYREIAALILVGLWLGVAPARQADADGINLSWDECGAAGAEIKSFA